MQGCHMASGPATPPQTNHSSSLEIGPLLPTTGSARVGYSSYGYNPPTSRHGSQQPLLPPEPAAAKFGGTAWPLSSFVGDLF